MSENKGMILGEKDGVLVLTMDMPGNNLMTADFFREYEAVMAEVEKTAAEGSCKGLIIRSAGRHFSAGADVEALARRTDGELRGSSGIPAGHIRQKHFFTFLRELPFPVVSAVTGFCIGSGSEIAVNSHYRIAEENARIGQPESTFGILPALGGIARTVEICGMQNAYELVMSGKLITAERAHAAGWADMLVPKRQGLPEALELITYISGSRERFIPQQYRSYIRSYLEERRAEI